VKWILLQDYPNVFQHTEFLLDAIEQYLDIIRSCGGIHAHRAAAEAKHVQTLFGDSYV
jgi:hypothetical protein